MCPLHWAPSPPYTPFVSSLCRHISSTAKSKVHVNSNRSWNSLCVCAHTEFPIHDKSALLTHHSRWRYWFGKLLATFRIFFCAPNLYSERSFGFGCSIYHMCTIYILLYCLMSHIAAAIGNTQDSCWHVCLRWFAIRPRRSCIYIHIAAINSPIREHLHKGLMRELRETPDFRFSLVRVIRNRLRGKWPIIIVRGRAEEVIFNCGGGGGAHVH